MEPYANPKTKYQTKCQIDCGQPSRRDGGAVNTLLLRALWSLQAGQICERISENRVIVRDCRPVAWQALTLGSRRSALKFMDFARTGPEPGQDLRFLPRVCDQRPCAANALTVTLIALQAILLAKGVLSYVSDFGFGNDEQQRSGVVY